MKNRYYLPVSDEAKSAWEAYRSQYFDHLKVVADLCRDIGGDKFCVGFGGSLVAATFKGPVHPAFSDKPNKHGAHVLKSRGRSQAQKDSIKWVEARNEEIRKLVPSAAKIAESHGFISNVIYTHKEGQGSGCIYTGFEPFQATWFGGKSDIVLVAGDYDGFVQGVLEYRPDAVFDPPSFSTPAGYAQITEARYKFMKAEFELKKEEDRL